ncbi:MAG: VWA domain-containing protein, partial [Actinomycetota bacterium]
QLDVLDRVAPARPAWRRHVVAALQLLGLTLAVVAVARPFDVTVERTRSEGRILVLFDVSLSMEATDVDPDRLTAAKEAAQRFVDQVDDDVEVGLISFAGVVTTEVSPTLDRRVLRQRIDDLRLDLSTAIGDALSSASRLLVAAADDDGGRDTDLAPGAIVLLTDGETTVGRPTLEGAAEAAEVGIPVFTIAFGTQRGTVTDPVSGDLVPVPVRPAELIDVAELTGGQAFEAETGNELADAYDSIRDSLGDTLGEEIETVTEYTWRWTLAAFATLAAAWLLGAWWLRGMI